jgi:hypothetical protein
MHAFQQVLCTVSVWSHNGKDDRLDRTEEGTGQFVASPFAMAVRRAPLPESPKNSISSSMRRLFLRSGIRGLMFRKSSSSPSSLLSSSSSSRITVRFGITPRPAASRATRLPRVSRPVLRVRESRGPVRVGELIATRDPSGCRRSVEKSWTVLRRLVVDVDMVEPNERITARSAFAQYQSPVHQINSKSKYMCDGIYASGRDA